MERSSKHSGSHYSSIALVGKTKTPSEKYWRLLLGVSGMQLDNLRTMQEIANVKVEKSKRGAGGGWRAFVHEKMRGTKGTANAFKDLAVQYRALSAIEKQRYDRLGAAATTASKEGRVSFPAASSSASYMRRKKCPQAPVIQKPRRQLDDAIAEKVRFTCQEDRAKAKLKRAELQEELRCLQRFTQGTRDILRKHRLLESAGVTWQAFPHSTLALLAMVTADKLQGTRFLQAPVGQQQSHWMKQHRGILEQSAHSLTALTVEQQRLARPRRCFLVGTCLCRGVGFMWARVSARLKTMIDATPTHRLALMEGEIILEWVAVEEGNDRIVYSTHIPLMYLRPWRPTFALVKAVEAESTDDCKAFRGVLTESGGQQFMTATALMEMLNADVEHRVRGFRCSQRETVRPSFHGVVYVQRWPELDATVWKGSAEERKRGRPRKMHEVLLNLGGKRPRGDHAQQEPLQEVPVAEPEDLQDKEDAWNHIIYDEVGLEEHMGDEDNMFVDEEEMPALNMELVEEEHMVSSSSSSSSSSTRSSSSSTSRSSTQGQ